MHPLVRRHGTQQLSHSFPYRQLRALQTASLDYKHIRDHASTHEANAQARNMPSAQPHKVGQLYDDFRSLTAQVQAQRTQLNTLSRQLSCAPTQQLREQAKQVKQSARALDARLAAVHRDMLHAALRLPNLAHPEVPHGEPRVVKVVGSQHTEHRDWLRDHLDVALRLGIVDLQAAARVAGSRFVFWRKAGALLELALVQWAVGRAVQAGFTPHVTPDMARASVVDACGFRPRSSGSPEGGGGEPSQTYRATPEALEAPADDPLCLVATAEIPLVAMRLGQEVHVPERLAGLSHCFRAEAGARGRDTRGVYRLHQFTKVELVVLARPDESNTELDRLVDFQAALYADLGLTFRVLDMPMHELGASAYRKYDVEAWMPGRRAWGEVSSASNCTDYQARRLGIRTRCQGELVFVHTLNATAVAVPRLIVAILESFQQEDGSVVVPEVLRPWMMGMDVLRPEDK